MKGDFMKQLNYIVDKNYYKTLFSNMGEGLIHGKIIFDENKNIVDFIFIDMNKTFKDILSTTFVKKIYINMLQVLREVSETSQSKSFEYYDSKLNMHYKINIFSCIKDEFYALFVNVKDLVKGREYDKMYRTLIEESIDAIIFFDKNKTVIEVNKAAEKLYGYKRSEFIGMDTYYLLAEEEIKNIEMYFSKVINEGISFEAIHKKKDGTKFQIEVSSNSTLLAERNIVMSIIRDISDRKVMENNLEYMANYDFLTNVYNRAALIVKFLSMIKWSEENNEKLAVLFFDIDKFKHINDTYGHTVGDVVLIEIAARINSIIKKEDILGRMGGDEFVVVKSCVKSNEDVVSFINEIFNAFIKPIEVDGKTIMINTSIGVAIFPDDAQDRELLINFSDDAMYQAKKIIGNSYKMYSDTLHMRW
jgi:diguanylate cyclase (GGDEF)-like protein/PAS domain S-box-containing protein